MNEGLEKFDRYVMCTKKSVRLCLMKLRNKLIGNKDSFK